MDKNAARTFLRCAVCATAMAAGFRAGAQVPSADVSFEVASVRPVIVDASHPFNPKHFWVHVTPAGASYWSMTPNSLVSYAYGVESFQVTGPEWANAERFDIEARFPDGADKKDERKMLQALLKDRFKLAFHVEQREMEVNVLTVGKRADKLKPSVPDSVSPEAGAADAPAQSKITTTADGTSKVDLGKKGTWSVKFDQELWANHFEYSKVSMEELAGRLSNCLGSGGTKVIDETGLKGNYQVAYDCPLPVPRPATGTAGTPSEPQDGSLLSRSLDATGLKLEKRKMQQDVYVIDRVERPSGN